MPLSYLIKPRIKIGNKIQEVITKGLNYLKPEVILFIFLLVAIILSFIKIEAIGFYVVFGIFIIGYFAERISKILRKK